MGEVTPQRHLTHSALNRNQFEISCSFAQCTALYVRANNPSGLSAFSPSSGIACPSERKGGGEDKVQPRAPGGVALRECHSLYRGPRYDVQLGPEGGTLFSKSVTCCTRRWGARVFLGFVVS